MNRDQALRQIEDWRVSWDVVVVGGGATGLGAALDAASRGYKVLLLEQSDFAKGTSSRSTKLIHGGVRYLRQGNVAMVVEGLRERGLLMRNAPHLVQRREFVLPCYRRCERAIYDLGLRAYDQLAGRLGIGNSRVLSAPQTRTQIPNLRSDGLRGAVAYYDGQFDDARLAISLAQTVTDCGGTAINYVKVVGLLKKSGKVSGVRALELEQGHEYEIQARAVVNATGAFADQLLQMDEPGAAPILTLSQGIHLVFERRWLPGDAALMVPRTDDGRVLFAIPWLDKVVVGTTDTPVGGPTLEPQPAPNEIDFILEHLARYLAPSPGRDDITSAFAGLRPLVKPRHQQLSSKISRDFAVTTSASRLVTVTGGKWTIYRKMGEACVNRVALVAGLEKRESKTRTILIHGWAESGELDDPLMVYGSEAGAVRELAESEPALGARLHSRLPYLQVQAVWGARHELARSVEDVLARRTRALFLDARASIEAAAEVASLLARELGRNQSWVQEQVRLYSGLASRYLVP